MTVHSFWQQSLTYPAARIRKLADLWWPGADGIRAEAGTDALLVRAQSTPAMSVRVNSGFGKKTGYVGYNDALMNVTIGTANASNPRIDLIVLRWRDTESGDPSSSCTVEVIAGTPAATPSTPSLTGTVVQVLAEVLVAAGTTTIAASAITDRRVMVVNSLEVDSGWINFPFAGSFASFSTFTAQYRRLTNKLHLHGAVSTSNMTASASNLIGNIPAGFRPSTTLYTPVASGLVASPALCIIDASGDVTIRTGSTMGTYYFLPPGPLLLD